MLRRSRAAKVTDEFAARSRLSNDGYEHHARHPSHPHPKARRIQGSKVSERHYQWQRSPRAQAQARGIVEELDDAGVEVFGGVAHRSTVKTFAARVTEV